MACVGFDSVSRGPHLLDIVKRIVESATTLEQYDPAKFLEGIAMARVFLTLYNQDLLDRQEVKDYLEGAFEEELKKYENNVPCTELMYQLVNLMSNSHCD